jgi:CheY-like chemotaxis protein
LRSHAPEESVPFEGGSADTEAAVQVETERLRTAATWEPIDVTALLTEVRPVLEVVAQTRNVTLEWFTSQHLTTIPADRVMLRQAILNAAMTVIALAPSGEVVISDYASRRGLGLRIAARAFSGSGATPGQVESCELRLDVCRELMVALKGALVVHDRPGGACEILLEWPTARPRVLLAVDDNEHLITLFRRRLAGANWQVRGASGGAQAREAIAAEKPTVILLDVMMPGEDGWDLLMSLKRDPETQDIPIIVCSVLREPEIAMQLGAASYLQKPVTHQALMEALSPWS